MQFRKTVVFTTLAVLLSVSLNGFSEIEFLKAVPDGIDFGTVEEGPPVAVTVTVRNTGTAPVEITNVRTNCACTEAVLEKHSLNPGEQAELNVIYTTDGRPGPFEKKVIFTTNIPGEEPLEIFTLKGTVNEAPSAKIAATPRRITLAGNDRRDGKKQAVAIENEGSLPLVVTGIRSRDGENVYFDGSGQAAVTIDPGQTKTVEIQLAGKAGSASEREYILIECNARNAGDSGYFIIVQYDAP